MKHLYEVIVGNIGTVHSGPNKKEALRVYRMYRQHSLDEYGRAANESVTLMCGERIIAEHDGVGSENE